MTIWRPIPSLRWHDHPTGADLVRGVVLVHAVREGSPSVSGTGRSRGGGRQRDRRGVGCSGLSAPCAPWPGASARTAWSWTTSATAISPPPPPPAARCHRREVPHDKDIRRTKPQGGCLLIRLCIQKHKFHHKAAPRGGAALWWKSILCFCLLIANQCQRPELRNALPTLVRSGIGSASDRSPLRRRGRSWRSGKTPA
ncbi:MAG: hypothetical protein H6Q00_3400 [Holophagaceae bacterium]|nr:hypothetical protein [Holophagaceae bacterium]